MTKIGCAATVVAAMALTACTTPRTMLRHPGTGQVVSCGGNTSSSIVGGAIGYSIQQNSDRSCVESYQALGFQVLP